MIYDRCIWKKKWLGHKLYVNFSDCYIVTTCTGFSLLSINAPSDAPTSVQPPKSNKKPVTMNRGVEPRPDGDHIVPLSQHPIAYSPNTSTFQALNI